MVLLFLAGLSPPEGPDPGCWIDVLEESLRQDPASRLAAKLAAPLMKSRLLGVVFISMPDSGSYPTLRQLRHRDVLPIKNDADPCPQAAIRDGHPPAPALDRDPGKCHNLPKLACPTTAGPCGLT